MARCDGRPAGAYAYDTRMKEGAIRAAIFDVGNTLWFQAVAPDVDAIVQTQAERVGRLLGAWGIDNDVPLEAVLREIWDAFGAADALERERGSLRELDLSALIRGLLARWRIAITAEEAEAWHRAAWVPVRLFGVQLYPDAVDVLRELHGMGMRVGINTNRPCTAEMFEEDLADFGLAPYVNAVVCSGDTGFVKPHASTFELVLRRLGVTAGEAVMVGDSADGDMRGAKAVGMRTVWKLNGRYDVRSCADADYTIHDLCELLSLPLFGRDRRAAVSVESLTPHEDGNADRY